MKFNIANFTKSASLAENGMKPVVYSEKAALEGRGWEGV